jgi:hypothetical protein
LNIVLLRFRDLLLKVQPFRGKRRRRRWGRHWLDVARYADSNGMDDNLAGVPAPE